MLPVGTIHLFVCLCGRADEALLPRLTARLNARERDRAARFAFTRDRWTYVAAHALLRYALDQLAGPRPWEFEVDHFGKPRLQPPCSDLRFSLSHTEGLVAVALSRGQEVGVDVEPADRQLDDLTFSDLVLAGSERAELDRAPDRSGRLLHLWVVKEAIAKALGRGLSLPFDQIVVAGDPPVLRALPPGFGDAGLWWLRSGIEGAHWLAMAAERVPPHLERIDVALATLLE